VRSVRLVWQPRSRLVPSMHVMSPDYRVELTVPRGPRCRTAADACADITLDGVLGSDVPAARGDNRHGRHPVLPLSRRAAPTSSTWTAAGPQTAPMGRSEAQLPPRCTAAKCARTRSATTTRVQDREIGVRARVNRCARRTVVVRSRIDAPGFGIERSPYAHSHERGGNPGHLLCPIALGGLEWRASNRHGLAAHRAALRFVDEPSP
jgi:hypothetical protein